MYYISALFIGILFALGLGLGGMLNPANVVGFLDVTGHWQPALALVMSSALVVYGFISHFALKKFGAPLLLPKALKQQAWSHIPKTGWDLSVRAKLGNVAFGLGWGLSGYCPGPALTSLSGMSPESMVFVVSMIVGFFVADVSPLSWFKRI